MGWTEWVSGVRGGTCSCRLTTLCAITFRIFFLPPLEAIASRKSMDSSAQVASVSPTANWLSRHARIFELSFSFSNSSSTLSLLSASAWDSRSRAGVQSSSLPDALVSSTWELDVEFGNARLCSFSL